ncbi:hypothetical protein [Desulfitobacterium sp.]|uniref:hypothetical protein n=1 Tax=Desulfitobacterium sp. TaxID=49981 RepID=UPI002B1F1A61|nr:hypothetical protein [Desulfitobacterium sp.]MEA4901877.1 hypothetical protein [Desulfitobacterium sp.]
MSIKRERPILFSTLMVQAILGDRKTMTRRIVKGTALEWLEKDGFSPSFVADPENRLSPYTVGDILWVRETWNGDWCDHVIYKADGGSAKEAGYTKEPKWKPSIFMPRKAARLFLRVTSIRAERLQDITEADCYAEGIIKVPLGENMEWAEGGWAIEKFAHLWDSLNAKRGYGWDTNPWVWVITFQKEDAL